VFFARSTREMQTPERVERLRQWSDGKVKMSVWQAMEACTEFSDPSRPSPLIHHLFNTAEALRSARAADWLQVAGLIHGLGVVLAYVRGREDDGTSQSNPATLVAEMRVVRPAPAGEGLDRSLVSFNQAEYLHRVLERTPGVKLPHRARQCIRYHTLDDWHTRLLHDDLESADDRAARDTVRRFAEYCRRHRGVAPRTVEVAQELRAYYHDLVARFLPDELLW
jgi:inositol oxygenase